MAKTITLYRIFLASPSDLKDERNLLEDIIEEINLSTFIYSNIKIELVKWETHASPDIGDYPQQVINNDIGNDYDIFIGLLWSKFGSPTVNFGSGTEEEFYNAYSLYKKSPSSIKIMFYFKQAAIPIDHIDTESINSIRKFKSELGDKGVLYWEYNTIEEFQKLIRIQITRKISELKQLENLTPVLIEKEIEVETDEELGLLDYIGTGEDNFSSIEEILLRMTDAIEWIGKRFIERTAEINRQTALNPQMGTNLKKRLVNASANDLLSFNKRLSTEIPLFAETYKRGIDSFSNAIKISFESSLEKEEDLDFAVKAIDDFIEIIQSSNLVTYDFRKSMTEFPRMTKEFNQAKRLSVGILDSLINEFEIAVNLAKALRAEFLEYKKMY